MLQPCQQYGGLHQSSAKPCTMLCLTVPKEPKQKYLFCLKRGNGEKCLSCCLKGISIINHWCPQKLCSLTAAWWGFGSSHFIYIQKDLNPVGGAGRSVWGSLVLPYLISASFHLRWIIIPVRRPQTAVFKLVHQQLWKYSGSLGSAESSEGP